MKVTKCEKPSFSVIGKVGSTLDGEGFVQRLWADANSHFEQISGLAKKNEQGGIVGIWGAMSDMSMSFLPWEDGFSKGRYLAGVECVDDAEAPEGWVKWTVPGFEYICVENDAPDSFAQGIRYLEEQQLELVGAVHDFTDPATGKGYQYYPVREL